MPDLSDREKSLYIANNRWNNSPGSLTSDEQILVCREYRKLHELVHTPQTDDWFLAVRTEAAFQVEKWGHDDREGKTPADWFWLIGFLAGKALTSFLAGDKSKGLHHIISTSAVLLNWHRCATGEMTAMRPGTKQG